jgi:hypothetical protein
MRQWARELGLAPPNRASDSKRALDPDGIAVTDVVVDKRVTV